MEIFAYALGTISLAGILLYPLNVLLRNRERQRDRELLIGLVRERYEVVKTALSMGYQEAELERLDSRLRAVLQEDQYQELVQNIRIKEEQQGGAAIAAYLDPADLSSSSEAKARAGAKEGERA